MSLAHQLFKHPAPAPAHRPGRPTTTIAPTWSQFFTSSRDIPVPASQGTFRVFEVPPSSASSPTSSKAPLFVLHHGAGHTALSWALAVGKLRERVGNVGVVGFDCRGHGVTTTQDDTDLSLDTLAADLVNLLDVLYPDAIPEVILVGHSMGGAVVTEAALTGKVRNLLAVAVLDVVEGTAVDSLAHMEIYLRNRPSHFRSIDQAVEWSVTIGGLRNLSSALISVPPQLVEVPGDGDTEGAKKWVWRTDLGRSQKHWHGWFQGLSANFLSIKAARMLILAGTDRLDTALTIGQMQGKFQLVLYPESGHAIQEDEPDKLATTLADLWQRNGPGKIIKRFPIPPLKPGTK
ncbi:Alpha/Beta hydrolase protein [Fimicolochytrium jonesii]|uniref:Alpha/Beta hydrolase protein n=1 Tax=Fimicolochytrium jonesii TaxID=1396493 RepID=UPI0022FE9B51|nr:Alpha/Beta hydrolase protein [Fimicolochytrium jonesii]KAI8823563.1 Alpha/Beta hydrolase protein [Fimicolochytrium jonesii]